MSNIMLEPRHEAFVKRQLSSGRFNDESDVVRAGLELLENMESERERWLRKEIPARLTDAQQNPGRGIPAEDVLSEVATWTRERAAKTAQ